MQKTNNSTSLPLDETRTLILMTSLQELVSFLYISVLKEGPYMGKLEAVDSNDVPMEISRFPKSSCPLTDLKVIVGDLQELSVLVHLFEDHISQEWFEPWENFNWVVNNLIARLLEVVIGVGLCLPRVISSLCKYFFKLCRTFGHGFLDKKVKPKFQEALSVSEDQLETQVLNGQTALTTALVPVYAAGVLTTYNSEEDRQQLIDFLQDILCTLAMCQAPVDSIRAAFIELGTSSSNHDLLLTVLWDVVVHSSSLVRCVGARTFELVIKGVSENLVSTRVVPALVTLANDPEISVRIATIPALGAIIESITLREMLDRVYMQLQSFFDDPMCRGEHSMQVDLIGVFARVGPNAEPRFRDEFVLPRLAAMALANNHMANETKRTDIAMQLFEAYSAMSCCFINDQLIQEAMLPGLRCLRQDMIQIAPDHEEVVISMIREYEGKVDTGRPVERSGSFSNLTPTAESKEPKDHSGENMKQRMMSRLKDTTSKANIRHIFTQKK